MKNLVRLRLPALLALLVVAWSLVLAPPHAASAMSACTCTVFGNATPGTVDAGPDASVKLGMFFTTDTYGWATGMRFYKSAANTGTHTGQLWRYVDGSHEFLLSQVTFTGETASGWQTANFSQPIYLIPNTHYEVSYIAPNAHFAYDVNYFSTLPNPSPLHVESPGGGYTYTTGTPANDLPATPTSTNYWVDVNFEVYQNESSLFRATTATPAVPSYDSAAGQVGTKFYTDTNTKVVGVRFWGSNDWYHPYGVNLWTSSGTLLASAQDGDNSIQQGWHELYFATPVAISAGVTYTAAITDFSGSSTAYGYTPNYFNSAYNSGQFHTPVNAGVYSAQPTSTFPNTTTNTNFWVDPVFANEGDVTASATVDPSFTFGIANKATACNGESNFISGAGSATGVAFGHLASGANASGGQALTVAGNAGSGFNVFVRGAQSSQNLRTSGHNWVDVVGTYGAAAPLGVGERFGYTFADSTAASSVSNPASANFVALDATNRAIMGSGSSMIGTGCISFDAQTASSTPAASYTATVIYTAVPSF